MKYLLLLVLFSGLVLEAKESMDRLLNEYQDETKLSNITKRESAGFLELYTRDELEKMQAHNLLDIFKTIPGLILTKDSITVNTFKKQGMDDIPDTIARVYINDHDMTSASFGSAFLVWADMPIEYVDHIEVYKATSSIEFGNEVGSLIIKVYTKTAKREEGGKVRLLVSDNGGYDTNVYYGQSLENGFSYFAYFNKDNIKQEDYHNIYNGHIYDIKDGKRSTTFFANLNYNEWILDIGIYDKDVDAYIGPGIQRAPLGDGVASQHTFAHLSKRFENGVRLQLAYDHMHNDGHFLDASGIGMFDPDSPYDGKWLVNDYHTVLNDYVYSLIVDKKFHFGKNELLVGGFYKYKKFEDCADLIGMHNYEAPANFYFKRASVDNSLNLYSLYFENNYFYDKDLQFVSSMKGDFYRYKKRVKSQDKLIARAGVIKNLDAFQFKMFASRSYIPATFLELYNETSLPLKVNPNLKYSTQDAYSLSARYKRDRHQLEFIATKTRLKDAIIMDYTYGYQNLPFDIHSVSWEMLYKYIYNRDNKLYLTYTRGKNKHNMNVSPAYNIGIRLFNRYKKFDFYNEMIIRAPYSNAGLNVGRSYDYTAAVKYHYSKDLSFGLRGDNIFNSGYRQSYRGYGDSIPITRQRFWCNVEVLF